MPKKQQHKETALVRTLVYALGVAPGELGLVPDDEGWVPVKELIKALHEQEGWRGVRESMVQDAAVRLAQDELELDQKRIRSKERKPPRPEYGAAPPAHLYIGLRPKAWPAISKRGLEANQAGPVLLAEEREWALRLGRRRGPDPVLVTVQAHHAADQGVVFALCGPSLYFCDWLPASCLMGPKVEEKPAAKKPAKPLKKPAGPKLPLPEEMPGVFSVMPEDIEKPYKEKGIRKRIDWKDRRRKDRRQH